MSEAPRKSYTVKLTSHCLTSDIHIELNFNSTDHPPLAQLFISLEDATHECYRINTDIRFQQFRRSYREIRMKKAIGALLSTALLFTSHQASATQVWTAYTTITSVEVITDGGFIVTLASGLPAGCSAAHGIYVQAGPNGVTADGVKALLAEALSAHYLKQTIRYLYDDATQYCYGAYATVTD